MFTRANYNNIVLLLLLALLTITINSCQEDEENQMTEPLVYNAEEHVYGTMSDFRNYTTEVVLELETGRFDSIPGTTESAGLLNFPFGASNLTDFENNRRIALSLDENDLVIQDLNNFEYDEIPLIDPETGLYLVNPDYLIFGKNSNEVYVFNSNTIGSLWLVNLATRSVESIQENISFDDHYVHYLFFDKTFNSIVFMGGQGAINDVKATAVFVYDLEQKMIVDQYSIPPSFGFVNHPNNENIYCLNLPTDSKGFRLMRLKLLDGLLQKQIVSMIDLNIDNLSTYIQTIHSATNTYICRGGSNSNEIITNTIYSIDLTNGNLVAQVELENSDGLMKLAGE